MSVLNILLYILRLNLPLDERDGGTARVDSDEQQLEPVQH